MISIVLSSIAHLILSLTALLSGVAPSAQGIQIDVAVVQGANESSPTPRPLPVATADVSDDSEGPSEIMIEAPTLEMPEVLIPAPTITEDGVLNG